MRAEVDRFGYASGKIGVRTFGNVVNTVVGASFAVKSVELLHVASRLESESLEKFKRGALRDDRNVERARRHDRLAGQIRLINRDNQLIRRRRALNDRIRDATIVFISISRRKNKESVGQLVHCLRIHRRSPYGRKKNPALKSFPKTLRDNNP